MEQSDKLKKYEKNLLWELPIEIYGLKLYPIIMRNVYEFYDSISTLQINPMEFNFGAMSEQLSALSYLELVILFAKSDKEFQRRLNTILKLAFRVSDESIRVISKNGKIALMIVQNGIEVEISSGKFNKIKDIICFQNSIEILDLKKNQRILDANRRVDALNNAGSTLTIEDQIYSVAAISQIDIKEIEKWSIYRFKKMTESHDNIINYKIFKSAEMSGFVTFKSGNPFQSWMTKAKDTTKELKTVNELAKTFGLGVQGNKSK